MKPTQVSYFSNGFSKTPEEYSLDRFLQNVQSGTWQDQVLHLRNLKSEAEQKDFKIKKLPGVTLSGRFSGGKADKDLVEHSNLISIDFDDLEDVQRTKDILDQDVYSRAVFVSCRGRGLCVIVRIDGKHHERAFEGLQQYYWQTYGLIVDPSGRNVARLRFVSFDPDLREFPGSHVFKLYPEKEKKRPDTRQIFFGNHDIDHVFDQIQERKVDITGNYLQWCSIGFALANYYGESGRERFHAVSQYAPSYDSKKCDQQYNSCLKHDKQTTGRKNTIATFLWYAKQQNISIVSDQTRVIVSSAKMGRNGNNTIEGTVKLLEEFEGMAPEMTRPIVEQVYAATVEVEDDKIPLWIKLEKYFKEYQPNLRRSVLNNEIYRDNLRLAEKDIIDITIDASRKIMQPVGKDMVNDYLKSSGVLEFHPLRTFFESMTHPTAGHIRRLAESLNCKHGLEYAERIVRRWLVGCVASAYDQYSSMMLVLVGAQRAGKSSWIKQLLPANLPCRDELVSPHIFGIRNYQDDLVLSSCWIAIDEEFVSMEKIGYKRMKAMITQPTVFMRYNFDKRGQIKPRLVNFAAGANDTDFLEDSTGNRRFGVIEVVGSNINWDVYNSVDKYEVWKEAYHLYTQGVDVDLTDEDMKMINDVAEEYRQRSKEEELILKHFSKCSEEDPGALFITATSIAHYLQVYSTHKNLSIDKVAKTMKLLGFDNNNGRSKRFGNKSFRGFWVLVPEDRRQTLLA